MKIGNKNILKSLYNRIFSFSKYSSYLIYISAMNRNKFRVQHLPDMLITH